MASFSPELSLLLEEDSSHNFENDLKDIRKPLIFDTPYTKCTNRLSRSGTRPVEVYLRIRPAPSTQGPSSSSHPFPSLQPIQEEVEGSQSCLQAASDTILLAKPPPNTARFIPQQEGEHFIFSKIYNKDSTQSDIFNESLVPILESFLNGQDCLVLAYGVTNSGKTFTVTGSPSQPGLLPRSVDVIFNSISPFLYDTKTGLNFKPNLHSNVTFLNEKEVQDEQLYKEALMKLAEPVSHLPPPPPPPPPPSTCNTTISNVSCLTLEDEKEDRSACNGGDTLNDVTSLSVISGMTDETCSMINSVMSEFEVQEDLQLTVDTQNDTISFSIFVSYAEIYNEFIFDLLSDKPINNRPPLKMSADASGNHYIKGLKEIKVDCTREALQLLRLGMARRHIAATRLNYTSSRSHTIYTIKLIRVEKGIRKPRNARINRLSIVDLAGSERSKKTGAKGDRMKEAGSINTSLLTLGRCIEAMKRNQNKKRNDSILVPFRESKLTQLLQIYFVGKGKGAREGQVAMFVNVCDIPSVFGETYHVLKFSALASKVVPMVKNIHVPQASAVAKPVQVVSSSSDFNESHYINEIQRLREEHMREITSYKLELWEQENKIRQQVSAEYNQQIVEIEDRHIREMNEQETKIEEEIEERVEIARKSAKKLITTRRKRQRTTDSDEEGGNSSEIIELKRQVSLLKFNLKEITDELEEERNKNSKLLEDQLTTYQTKITAVNNQMYTMKLNHDSILNENKNKMAALEKSRDELKQQLKELTKSNKDKLRELNLKFDEEVSKNISLTRELLQVQETLASTQEQLHDLSLLPSLPPLPPLSSSANTTTIPSVESFINNNNNTSMETSRLEQELKDAHKKIKDSIDDCQSFVEALHKSEDKREVLESQLKMADETLALYEKEKEELLLQVIELESSCGRLTERIDVATQTITDNQVSKLQQQIDIFSDQLSEKDMEIELLQTQKEKLTHKELSLSTEIEKLKDEVERNTRKLREQFEQDKCGLEEEITRINCELLKYKNSDKEERLKNKVIELEEQNCHLSEEREQLQTDIKRMEERLNEELLSMKKIQKSNENLQKENDVLIKEMETKKLKEGVNQDAIESLETQLKHLKIELKDERDTVQEEKHIIAQELEQKQIMSQELSDKLRKLEESKMSELAIKDSQIQKSEVVIDKLQCTVSQLQNQLEGTKKCLGTTENENTALTREIQEKDQLITQLQTQLGGTQQLIETLQKKREEFLTNDGAELRGDDDNLRLLLDDQNLDLESVSGQSSLSEHLYDEPPLEKEEFSEDPTYDSIHVLSESSKDNQQQEEVTLIETPQDTTTRSGRHLALLERSSQLLDDSSDDFEPTPIKYNMLTDAKKKKPAKTKKPPKSSKKEKPVPLPPSLPVESSSTPHRYNLRRKGKTPAAPFPPSLPPPPPGGDTTEDEVVDENSTPTKLLKALKKATRSKRKPIDKSTISGPLDYVETPPQSTNTKTTKFKLGSSVRPTSRHL